MPSSARKAKSSASVFGIGLLLRPFPAMPFTANGAADTRPSRDRTVKSAQGGRFAGINRDVAKSLRFPCCNRRALQPYRPGLRPRRRVSGCSSGVEHNLAKVGVERSNRFTRSSFLKRESSIEKPRFAAAFSFLGLSNCNCRNRPRRSGLHAGYKIANST